MGTEPEEIVQKVQTFASLGVQRLLITTQTGNMAELLPAMDVVARKVLPAIQ